MKQSGKSLTILMTGATGYLGSHILRAITQLHGDVTYKMIVLKRSSSNTFRIDPVIKKVITYNLDEINLEQVFEENAIDYILHCATNYGRKSVNPMQVIEANLVLPIKLLECGRKYNVKSFINTDTILDKGINHYSLSKKQFLDWLIGYKSNLVCVNVELGHFYGPGDDTTKFISYIVDQLVKNVEKIDLTLGEQKRNFTYVDDVVTAFIKVINHIPELEKGLYQFQVCGKEVVTIKEVVCMVRDMMKNTTTKLAFGALPYRENEVMTASSDSLAIKALGWVEEYTLANGLKKMVEIELLNNKTTK